jgi:hypothetical protein
MILEN